MHGHGTYFYSDGRKYVGEYKKDKKDVKRKKLSIIDQGFGKYFWNDGKNYEGYWKDGKQNGKGKLILKTGEIKFGEWENGKLKRQLPPNLIEQEFKK